jgi:cytochrome c553
VKKFLKWTGFVVAGLLGIALLGFAYIYVASELEINHHYTVTTSTPLTLPTDAAEIAEGARLGKLTGCTSCHRRDLGGQSVIDIPNVVRFVAPNLTTSLPKYSDAQLITLLRHGVMPDGRGVLFMPSHAIRNLHDEDLARIIAWARAMPAVVNETEKSEVRLVGRFILATGKYKTPTRVVEETPGGAASVNMNDALSRGRYYALSFCSECHGASFEGNEAAHSPPLVVAKGYSAGDFSKLLHEGTALGGRELKLMTPTARSRFAVLTPEETADLYAFLQTL